MTKFPKDFLEIGVVDNHGHIPCLPSAPLGMLLVWTQYSNESGSSWLYL